MKPFPAQRMRSRCSRGARKNAATKPCCPQTTGLRFHHGKANPEPFASRPAVIGRCCDAFSSTTQRNPTTARPSKKNMLSLAPWMPPLPTPLSLPHHRFDRFKPLACCSSVGRREAKEKEGGLPAGTRCPETWSSGAWKSWPRRRSYTRWTSPSRATPAGPGTFFDGWSAKRGAAPGLLWSTERRATRRRLGRVPHL